MTHRLVEIGSALDSVVACKIIGTQLEELQVRGGRAEVLTLVLDDGSVMRVTAAGNDGWEFWLQIEHEPG